jgi:choline dehydrogenase-like flavoprotein
VLTETETEVVVAGAGPTGLMLAYELSLAGVRTLVLEKLHQHVEQVTGGGIQPLPPSCWSRAGCWTRCCGGPCRASRRATPSGPNSPAVRIRPERADLNEADARPAPRCPHAVVVLPLRRPSPARRLRGLLRRCRAGVDQGRGRVRGGRLQGCADEEGHSEAFRIELPMAAAFRAASLTASEPRRRGASQGLWFGGPWRRTCW